MGCDMCGKESKLFRTKVEGSTMNVCDNCAKYGQVLGDVSVHVRQKKISREEESVETIVPDYNKIIKSKREQLNLNQEDFAKKLNEKVSVIQHLESGKMKPSINLAKKLEREFTITLIEQGNYEYKPEKTNVTKEGFTLGDMIKVKKRTK